MGKLNAIFLFIVGVSRSGWLVANESRNELTKAYTEQLQNNPSFFATAPVYHITPDENTISFAADYRSYDVTVAPPGVDISSCCEKLTERMDLAGWSLAPYVAFSTKTFGFGFAGETGRRNAHYLQKASADKTYREQLGTMSYSGVGVNAFVAPRFSLLPKFAEPTIILGTKSLNIIHQTSGDLLEPYSAVEMKKYQYTVQNYEIGCNVALRLVKRFTIIPWIDYSPYRYSRPKPSAGGTIPALEASSAKSSIDADAELFWNTNPSLNYGIDFAIKILGFNIHLGGMMGILGNLNKGSDRIQDDSRTLSVSFDMRAN